MVDFNLEVNRQGDNIDMAARRRIDEVEKRLDKHLTMIENLESSIKENTSSLAENTRLTQEIATNTGELVQLFKGAKAFRKFVMWTAGIATALTAIGVLLNLLWHWIWPK